MSPSMGMPGLSFALFSIHGPLSGTWWNPQLDSQSSPMWSCLYSPPFTRGCAAVCSVQTKALPPSGSPRGKSLPLDHLSYLLETQQGWTGYSKGAELQHAMQLLHG